MLIPDLVGVLDDLWWETCIPSLAQQIAYHAAHPTPPEPEPPTTWRPREAIQRDPPFAAPMVTIEVARRRIAAVRAAPPPTTAQAGNQLAALEAAHDIDPGSGRCRRCQWTVSAMSLIEPFRLTLRCPPGPLLGTPDAPRR